MHDSRIFFTQCECHWINVYEAFKPYKYLRRITVDGMRNPSDLLVFDDCLYVPDDMTPRTRHVGCRNPFTDHCVWRIRLSGSEPPEKMLTSLGRWWPWTLSTTLDGRQIIITTTTNEATTNKAATNKAYFWIPSRNKLEMVTLPDDLHRPQHIIELSYRSYLICHDPEHISRLRKVCRLIRNGDKMSFTESPSFVDDLDFPEHLAELPDGRILVADFYKNRVLVMAKDLSICKILLCPKYGDKKRPCRIAYYSGSKKLLVAFHHSVGVYSLNADLLTGLP